MADYVTTKEVVAYGMLGIGMVISGLGVWVGVTFSKLKQRLERIERCLDDVSISQRSNGDIQKALDQAIAILRSGKNETKVTTNNDAKGGSANDS